MPNCIVGIGISEQFEIAWELSDATTAQILERKARSVPAPALNIRDNLDLEREIGRFLFALRSSGQFSSVFENEVVAVGFGVIGRINLERPQLTSIARKRWATRVASDGNSIVADLEAAARPYFPQAHIVAQNDTSAAALAETRELADGDVRTMFYVTLGEGVNAGLVFNGRLLPLGEHPEFGHTFPRLHRHDVGSKKRLGCSMHGHCYEALASAPRVREDWGAALEDLPEEHEAWSILGFYAAQLCLAGHAVFAPERIILGGSLMWGRDPTAPDCAASNKIERLLLPEIRKSYIELRGALAIGEAAFGRDVDPETLAETLIRRGSIYREANARGGLELARQSLFAAPRGV